MPVVIADVLEGRLDVDAHLSAVESPRQGAVASFIGRVRDHDPEVDGQVALLSYTAHPDVAAVMRDIAKRVAAQHDPYDETLIAISHRIGDLQVGDIALLAAVSSPHRALAFELCSALVEEVKRSLPIWKKQHDVDGGTVWSGLSDIGSESDLGSEGSGNQ